MITLYSLIDQIAENLEHSDIAAIISVKQKPEKDQAGCE